jgi:DnaT-like ssDNA binding protein
VAVTIDATVGGASANSFVLLAEMTTYMDTRLNGSLWTAALTDTQNRALVEATRELSALTWKETRASTTQALAWPRLFVINPDIPWAGSVFYASTEIPQRVKDATMELAFQFVNAGTSDLASQDSLQNIVEETVGPLTTRYSEPLNRKNGVARFPRVMNLIRPLLLSNGITSPILRG